MGGRPILSWSIEAFAAAGARQIVIVVAEAWLSQSTSARSQLPNGGAATAWISISADWARGTLLTPGETAGNPAADSAIQAAQDWVASPVQPGDATMPPVVLVERIDSGAILAAGQPRETALRQVEDGQPPRQRQPPRRAR